jgi:putative hydrolases of HD superfamily
VVKSTTEMKKRQSKDEKLASFLYETGTLRKIPRGHMQSLLTSDLSDNIASHSFRVAVIGWFLAEEEKADPYKVLAMCLFHDIGEARSGDQNWIHKKYVKVFEDEITSDQFGSLPHGNKLSGLASEYKQRKSKEAILAKDADILDQVLLINEYIWQGNLEALSWKNENKGKSKNTHLKLLKSKTAKKLARLINSQNPGDWWKNVWTEKRR